MKKKHGRGGEKIPLPVELNSGGKKEKTGGPLIPCEQQPEGIYD